MNPVISVVDNNFVIINYIFKYIDSSSWSAISECDPAAVLLEIFALACEHD